MRYCEEDGCEVYETADEMVRIGESWYCPKHAYQVMGEES